MSRATSGFLLSALAAASLCLAACGSGGGSNSAASVRTVTVTKSVPVPSSVPSRATRPAAPSGPDLIAEAEARNAGKPARHLQVKSTLSAYASCMRANGIAYPAPVKTAHGFVLETKGLDTTTARYRQANAKCASSALKHLSG